MPRGVLRFIPVLGHATLVAYHGDQRNGVLAGDRLPGGPRGHGAGHAAVLVRITP